MKQKRWFGDDGKAKRDRDYNHKGKGPFPHDHIWVDGKRGRDHLEPSPDYQDIVSVALEVGLVFVLILSPSASSIIGGPKAAYYMKD